MAARCFPNKSIILVLVTTNLLSKCRYISGKTASYGTKTLYEQATGNSPYKTHGDNECQNIAIVTDDRFHRCTPLHGHVIYRHGTRYPSSNYVQTTIHLWDKIRALLRNTKLKNWNSSFAIEDDKKLSKRGIQEMLGLGMRFGQRYCSFLSSMGPSSVSFVSSSKTRSIQSAESFKTGLSSSLGWKEVDRSVTPVTINDYMLRYFKKCAAYQKHLKTVTSGEPIYMKEYLKFLRGPEVTYVTKSISEKLNVPHSIITNEEVYAIYYIGAYNTIIQNDTTFMDLFDDDHRDILEYLEDLKHYWKKSYGFTLNYIISCGLMQQIHNGITDAITQFKKKQTYKAGIFQFGHAETVFPLYSVFGLHKDDEPLRADNYHLHKNRAFRSSRMVPFSANIAFILYHCDSGDDATKDDKFFVQMIVNERPITLPGCEELCPLTTWTNKIQYLLDLDFNSFCETGTLGREDL